MSRSLIGMLRDRMARGNVKDAGLLFRMVAERVRTRVLSEDEADVIATWFEQIAKGEDPKKVLGLNPPGRPKGETKPRNPMANGKIPDDYDIAWIVRQNLLRLKSPKKGERGEVYKGVAKAFGMDKRTVENIYSRLKDELGPPPA